MNNKAGKGCLKSYTLYDDDTGGVAIAVISAESNAPARFIMSHCFIFPSKYPRFSTSSLRVALSIPPNVLI
jgi:hypothetical protein